MKSKFDSEQYSYADLSVQIGSRVLTGLRGLTYSEKQEMEYVYGKGNRPLAIQEGNVTYEGEVKMLQNELELLIEQAPDGRIQGLRDVQITTTYNQGETLVTDILTGVRFPEMAKNMGQGDKFMEVTLPIMFVGLKLNV